jgi:3-oxoacyl-[acyl-carrier protein] reductase
VSTPAAADAQLAGKRALVTGAGQGVGKRIAVVLAAAGCHVMVNDLDADRAERVAAAIRDDGDDAAACAFDVTDHEAARSAIDAAGPVDVLVNNAGNAGADGFGKITRFLDTSRGDWEPFLQVNVYGVMNCTHAVLPAMVDAGWGRVITIVSDAGRIGGAHLAPYSAAKAGAAGFSRAIAREVARHGVTANTIALGTMRTPMTEPLWADPAQKAAQDALLSDYLVRRPGDPDDAAWMVLTLASPRAGWITGQTIPVNGGLSFAL